MRIRNQEVSTPMRAIGAWLAVAGALLLPNHSFAQMVTLNDGGSQTTIDFGSSAGMNSWSVNGQNQLDQQWFWYQTDGGVAQPINTISSNPTITTYSGPNGYNEVTASYQNSKIGVTIDYFLQGGGAGSGNADIQESISIFNVGSSAYTLNFYQYSHFNLLGQAHDTVSIAGDPTHGYNFVNQANGATAISEAVASPNAQHAEAADYNQTLNKLNTVSGLTLNDNLTSGPGNETWALQWVQGMNPGDEFDIMKDKQLNIQAVPEPSTMALLALGAGALRLVSRRKKV